MPPLRPLLTATFTNVLLILCEKLTGSANYTARASAVQLWLGTQGRVHHFTN